MTSLKKVRKKLPWLEQLPWHSRQLICSWHVTDAHSHKRAINGSPIWTFRHNWSTLIRTHLRSPVPLQTFDDGTLLAWQAPCMSRSLGQAHNGRFCGIIADSLWEPEPGIINKNLLLDYVRQAFICSSWWNEKRTSLITRKLVHLRIKCIVVKTTKNCIIFLSKWSFSLQWTNFFAV